MIERKNDKHIAVLLDEAVEALQIQEGDVIVDATLGAGGHTLKILEQVGKTGKVIAFDLDKKAIYNFTTVCNIKVSCCGKICVGLNERLILVNDNFKNIDKIIQELCVSRQIESDKVDGILADLGWRIEQVQDERYGMSFQKEMLLDMRMSPETQKLTAKEIINEWSVDELSNIFQELGGESYFNSKKIAKLIIEKREIQKIKTTTELAELVAKIKVNSKQKINLFAKVRQINPATQVFQALRIAVNEELSNLNLFLEKSFNLLENKGRLVIISFHSLEDRLVKKFFRAKARGCVCPKEIPVCVCNEKRQMKIIQKKAIKEGEVVLKSNPRARSARMRVGEKLK